MISCKHRSFGQNKETLMISKKRAPFLKGSYKEVTYLIHQPAFGYYGYPRDSSFLYIFQERHSFSFLPPPPIGNSRVVNSSIRKVNLITEIPHSAIWTCFFLILFMERKMGWSIFFLRGHVWHLLLPLCLIF